MSNESRQASWNAWVEAPKSDNVEIQIRQWATLNNVKIISLYSKDCHRDIFDKLLGIKRESIFFHIEGEFEKLNELKNIFMERVN